MNKDVCTSRRTASKQSRVGCVSRWREEGGACEAGWGWKQAEHSPQPTVAVAIIAPVVVTSGTAIFPVVPIPVFTAMVVAGTPVVAPLSIVVALVVTLAVVLVVTVAVAVTVEVVLFSVASITMAIRVGELEVVVVTKAALLVAVESYI